MNTDHRTAAEEMIAAAKSVEFMTFRATRAAREVFEAVRKRDVDENQETSIEELQFQNQALSLALRYHEVDRRMEEQHERDLRLIERVRRFPILLSLPLMGARYEKAVKADEMYDFNSQLYLEWKVEKLKDELAEKERVLDELIAQCGAPDG